MIKQFKIVLTLLSLPATLLAMTVVSLDVAAQGSDVNRGIEEIVISSQKRDANLQEVPISASAFSAKDIRDKNITSVADLEFLSPSLTIQEQGGLKFINIRGVGIAAVSPQTTSGVAYHIDNFFVPNEIALSETYFDLSGIEILRGPQGTFVGQNSTGGAMFVTTASPNFEEAGYSVKVNAGSYGYRQLEGAVDIPFSENFAMRIAGNYEKKDGFFDNIGPTGDDPGSVDRQGLRASFLYQPSDTLEFGFKHEVTDSKSGGAFQKDLTDGIADEYTVAYGYPTKLDLDVQRSVFEVTWNLSDTLELRSTTGYQEVNQVRTEDADGTIAQVWDRFVEIEEETIQQEINLVSSFGGAFEFITGAFYFKDDSFFYSEDFVPGQMGGPSSSPFLAEWQVTDGKPAHESWSVYGEGSFHFTDSLELVTGIRYIDDTVSDDSGGFTCRRCTSPAALTTEGRSISVSANTTVTTGRVVLNWQANDDHLLYASISRGFKSGGFNPGRAGFDPEYVLSYEVGNKATLAGGLIQLNTSAYYYDYEGYQLRIFDATTGARSSLRNTSDTVIYGLESQLKFVAGGWEGNLDFGYGKSELQGLNLPDPRNPPPGGPELDLDGTELSYHPAITASAGLGYNFDMQSGTLTTRLQLAYTDDQWTQIYQVDPTDYLDSKSLSNFNIEYRSTSGWWVKGVVSNLTDEEYLSGKQINRAIRDVQYYGSPREFKLEFGWSTF